MSANIFLSVVVLVRNQAPELPGIARAVMDVLSGKVDDFEVILVDNASADASHTILEKLTGEEGVPNLQVYALTSRVDEDTAAWAGVENALGDYVAVFNPLVDDISILPKMIAKLEEGTEVVFATNEQRPVQSFFYRVSSAAFNWLYKCLNGVSLVDEAPRFRIISKRVVNYILQHPHPAVTYRYLPSTGGFSSAHISYSAPVRSIEEKALGNGIDRGVSILVSTTRAPMRLVAGLCLLGAGGNLVYTLYVIAVAMFKTNVAPGWISLSLQQSGMFFLLSLALLVLSEYILQMVRLSNEGPSYHVRDEMTSARILRRERLNVEDVTAVPSSDRWMH